MDNHAHRALFLLITLLCLLIPSSALAHSGPHTTPIQTYTQSVGPYELAITLELPQSVPATMYVDIAPQQPMPGATIRVRAAPRGQSADGTQEGRIDVPQGEPGIYITEVPVDQLGDWDLEVLASGPQGEGMTRLPFTLTLPSLPSYTIPLLASIGGLIILLICSIIVAAIFNQRQRPVPGWANGLLSHAMVACLVVAIIFGAQQVGDTINPQATANAATAVYGRPHANATLRTEPARPAAGQPFTLTVDLNDGSTGLPVDDLVTHHQALMHLILISSDGSAFEHIHPGRVGPGRFSIGLSGLPAGSYTTYVEIERLDSGTQVVRGSVEIAGTPAAATPAPGLGTREVDGLQVTISAGQSPLRAGKQATLTFSFVANGRPVDEIQPWLGMAGHLISRSDDGTIIGHIHAAEQMAPEGLTGGGMVYGPDIRFVYTFPQAGHYQLWAQFRYHNQIITVPFTVDVEG